MEGPSLVILNEELQPFLGKKVLEVAGNTKQPKEELEGKCLTKIETWGKVLFLTFKGQGKQEIVTKTHFMLFGSYRINDPKENRIPRIEFRFKNGTVYFYSCSFLIGAEEYLDHVDREVDLLSPKWDVKHVVKLMEERKTAYLCDLFVDQEVFAGSGNIVKNEVLFNLRRHPKTKLSDIEKKDWPKIARAVREYCFNFYEWKKKFELRKHWQVYRKSTCPICGSKLEKKKFGKLERKNFTCLHCQNPKQGTGSLKVHKVLPVKGITAPEKRLDH